MIPEHRVVSVFNQFVNNSVFPCFVFYYPTLPVLIILGLQFALRDSQVWKQYIKVVLLIIYF